MALNLERKEDRRGKSVSCCRKKKNSRSSIFKIKKRGDLGALKGERAPMKERATHKDTTMNKNLKRKSSLGGGSHRDSEQRRGGQRGVSIIEEKSRKSGGLGLFINKKTW